MDRLRRRRRAIHPTASLLKVVADMKKPKNLSGLYTTPPAREVRGPSGRLYGGVSLWDLKIHDPPRRRAIEMVESRLFDPVVLGTIICNCVTMAWESPLDPCCTAKAALIDVRSHTLNPPQRSPKLPALQCSTASH
jgi:hypothetical protein